MCLHKRLPQAKTSHDKDVLHRQIDATDRRINRLVYELYDLTAEEIAIVGMRNCKLQIEGSPGGTRENSPAIHRWVLSDVKPRQSRRDG